MASATPSNAHKHTPNPCFPARVSISKRMTKKLRVSNQELPSSGSQDSRIHFFDIAAGFKSLAEFCNASISFESNS
jgi:hypothetical protein